MTLEGGEPLVGKGEALEAFEGKRVKPYSERNLPQHNTGDLTRGESPMWRWRPSDARLSFFNEMDGVGIHGVARGIPIRSKWRAVAAQAQIGRHCRRILGRGVSTVQRDTRALLLHGDGSESLFPGPDWCPSLGQCSRLEGFDSPRCLAFGHFLLGKIVEIGMHSPSNVCAPYRTTHTTIYSRD